MIKKINKSFFPKLLNDLLQVFFPDLCVCCHNTVSSSKEPLCIFCQADLPFTNFHLTKDNPFTERFFGRLPIVTGASFLFFEKNGITQKIIHALKYKNRPDLGLEFGKMYGEVLKKSALYEQIDGIVAVPLHMKRKKERGYNQSAMIAKGLAQGMDRPFLKDVIRRIDHTKSQTKKSRLERFSNVEKAFELSPDVDIEDKHLLLVDDVLTTGATLEACGLALTQNRRLTLSAVTLAIAEN